MDFMLEEEMIDLLTFCLQNPTSGELESKKSRFKEIGKGVAGLYNNTSKLYKQGLLSKDS